MTPEYIDEQWTDEQFERFWHARNKRVTMVNEMTRQEHAEEPKQPGIRVSKQVSDVEMFSMMGIGEA